MISILRRVRLNAIVCLVISLSVAAAADDGHLPRSITHSRENGTHVYRISGIYRGFATDNLTEAESHYLSFFPNATKVSIDLDRLTFSVTTSRPLSIPTLRKVIDEQAGMGGDLPYWTEIQLRDLQKSPRFSPDIFRVVPLDGALPQGLAWFHASKDDSLRLPIFLAFDHIGTVLITHTTAHCMAEDRFAIRLLDAEGRLLWNNQEIALASCRFAVVDQDGDGFHELVIDRNDHGKEAHFLVTNVSEPALLRTGTAITPAPATPSPSPRPPRERSR